MPRALQDLQGEHLFADSPHCQPTDLDFLNTATADDPALAVTPKKDIMIFYRQLLFLLTTEATNSSFASPSSRNKTLLAHSFATLLASRCPSRTKSPPFFGQCSLFQFVCMKRIALCGIISLSDEADSEAIA